MNFYMKIYLISIFKVFYIIDFNSDTNNIIYGNNANEIKKYSNKYFELIESFYSINKLHEYIIRIIKNEK